jgi:hypothetical protein
MLTRRRFYTNHLTSLSRTIDSFTLDREEENKSLNRNGYKIRAFDKAIKLISNLDHPIRSVSEAMTVRL